MLAVSPRVAHVDDSEANPGYRLWQVTLDPVGQTTVAVTWKTLPVTVIDSAEMRDMLLLSQTPEIFAEMMLQKATELVAERMPAHVSNGLRRQIVHWYEDNRAAIAALLAMENSSRRSSTGGDAE